MNEEKYRLIIQNKNVFKETYVSSDVLCLKIGTTPDSDIRLKRENFSIPIALYLQLVGNQWHIQCDELLYISSLENKVLQDAPIQHGAFLKVFDAKNNESIFSISFLYDFALSDLSFDTIIDIRSLNKLVIGNSKGAQIFLSSKYINSEAITLTRNKNGGFQLDPTGAQKSATLNGNRIFDVSTVAEYDFIGVADYVFYLKNGVLYTALRDDIAFNGVSAQPLRDETPAFKYPKLNRSPRMLYAFDKTPIEILNPPQKPEKPRDNLALQLSPALLMIAVTVVTRSGIIQGLGNGNPSFLIFSLATMAVGIFTSVISFVHNRNGYKKSLEEWEKDYRTYIENKRNEIEGERQAEQIALTDVYPSSEHMRDLVKTFSGRIFERSIKDDDFLYVRAGLGAIPAMREVISRQEEHIKIDSELMLIPEQICKEYENLKNAPVLLHLCQSGVVGVVGSDDERYDFFKSLLLDICVEHSYEDVKVVVLIPCGEEAKYEWIKWMPHISTSGGDCRGIVCNDESRDEIFETLYAIMTERLFRNKDEEMSHIPYYVVFALEEYGIKTHPLSQFMSHLEEIGMSFVFFKRYKENLPKECEEIVFLEENKGTVYLSKDKAFSRQFSWEHINDESIKFVAERLAPVYCEQIALSSRLTSNITLFDLLNIYSPEDLDLTAEWKKSNVQRSLAAPLGVDTKGSMIYLDLHEKASGPHGLVAGTTGSGKSEIMQSYILSVAVKFHPYEVAFVIIDFKGGGMANQFENLPHLVGKITDIDSHEINRSLLSIRAELEKRKRLFAQCGVNHIDQYIGKFRRGETSVALPHLILIVDEFAELKAEQPEFMKELISTARVGRSLGIHLILATQKPAGQVNEQIWSNSRFKLCLKVATREDSMEVLHSPLASEIREPGRAYLQVGNNEIFTLFQSAYSGASAQSDQNGNRREFKISEVSFTGKRTVVYERKASHSDDGTKLTQLKALVDYVDNYCRKNGIDTLPSICMPPLPEIIDYETASCRGEDRLIMKIGVYDDPSNQVQPDVLLDLSEGNVMVIGASQTGKTLLLQTMLRRIAERYSPKQAFVYIVDFGSKILKAYEKLNHVGGVLTDADDERMKNFFKMIREEIESRKEIFSKLGIGSYETYLEAKAVMEIPRIMIFIDNLSAFKETHQEYEDELLNLCREGVTLGITLIVTAKQTAGLSYRYMSNFATRIAFNCTESSEYNNIFDRCPIRPQNIQGRGLISVQKTVYEFQAVLPFDGIVSSNPDETMRTEGKRSEQIKLFITTINSKYVGVTAKPVPEIPKILSRDYWNTPSESYESYALPIGLTYENIETATLDLATVGSFGILGKDHFGKSNLLRIILEHIQQNVFKLPCKAYLIDDYARQLEEFETFGYVEQISVDCTDLENIIQLFADKAKERMDIMRSGGDFGQLPLLLCVIQNLQVFSAGVISKTSSDLLKKLLVDAKQLKICIIFSNLENNADYSAPEMVKLTRDLGRYVLLDDLTNIKLFGSGKFTPNDMRQFKKPLQLGDGYIYDVREGLEKIKIIKADRVR